MANMKPIATLPTPAAADMKPHTYQPTKAEMEEELEMPGWSLDQVRETFMRPFASKDA